MNTQKSVYDNSPIIPVTWRSVAYAARFYGRSVITIQHWCVDGTFAVAEIPTYKDRKGRWWICITADGSLTIPTL